MKLVYLTQVFEIGNDYGSDRHHFHCKKLVAKGHEVVVVTSNIDYKTGKFKHAAKGFAPVIVDHQGMRIYYVYSKGDFHGSIAKRILYFISYLFFHIALAEADRECRYRLCRLDAADSRLVGISPGPSVASGFHF